jgi:phage shock protein PspC (stress-responsive transcriptional regulator)
MSIQEIVLKIKGLAGKYDLERVYTVIQAVLLGLLGLSFGLIGFFIGSMRQLKHQKPTAPISVIYPPLPITTYHEPEQQEMVKSSQTPSSPLNGNYVGSKTGKTYYTKDCKGINRIKPENRVYFTTQQEAQSQGRSLSKTCTSS